MKIRFLDKGEDLFGGWFLLLLALLIIAIMIFGFEYFPIKERYQDTVWCGRFVFGMLLPLTSFLFLVYYFLQEKEEGT